MANIINVVMTGNVSPLTAALAQGAAQLGAFGAKANRLGNEARTAGQNASRLGLQAEAAATRITSLGQRADEASAAAGRLRTQAAAGGAGAAQLGREADAAAARAARLRAEASAAGNGAAHLASQARLAAAEAERLGTQAERAAQRAQMVRTGMLAGAGGVVLFGAALAAAVLSAVSFEAKMRQVSSIDDSVKNNFTEMSQAVLNLAKELPQSADILAAGLYNIAGSGFYGAEALDILEISAKAAAAGMTTTDNSAKAIVATLNAYGLEADSAARVSDALFNVVNYGVLSYEELTAAVSHFVGNSAAAGISIEQAGAALATMTLSGLSASEAGVSLNNMISKLIKPSEALATAVDQLGINLEEDLKNPAIGLHGVMMQLMDASQGNLKTLLQWFPEIRAARGALALMSAEGDNYRRVFQGMGTEQANQMATQKAYNEVAKSTAHQFEVLAGSVQSTAIEIGLKLLPYVNQAISGLMELGGAAKDLGSSVIGALAPGFAALGDAIAAVAEIAADLNLDDILGTIASVAIGTVAAGFNLLASAISATTGFLADHTIAVEAMVAAWLLFKVGAIVVAINQLISAIVVGLIGAVGSAAAAVSALHARLILLGAGSLWRGALTGALLLGGGLAVLTAGIAIVVSEFGRMARAKEDIKQNKLSIEDILGSAPGGAAQAVREVADEMSNLGEEAEIGFDQARASLQRMKDEAVAGLDEMQKKADAAAQAKIWTADFWKFWDRPGQEVKKFEQIIGDLDAAMKELDTTQQYMEANTIALAAEYNISTDAVTRLAEKYDVDLSQALDAAGENGTTLREAFGLLANELTGAGATAEETAAAVEALDLAAGGAEKAVEQLDMALNFLFNTGINAVLSLDQVELAMLDLAEGAGLAEGGLTGMSRGAIQNRETLLGLVTQITEAARAQTEFTGSAEAGQAILDQYIPRLRALWTEAGRSGEEFDLLFEKINQGNALGGLNIPVTMPGLPEATVGTLSYGSILDGLARDVATYVSAPGLSENTGGFQSYGSILDLLARDVATYVSAPGLAESTSGTQTYDGALGTIDPSVSTQFNTPGLNTAIANVTALGRAIASLEGKRLSVSAPISGGTGAPVRGPGSASGGPVIGPGGPTSDQVPIMASNGEWVIRAAAARQYGPDVMAALNAGRALVIPRFASGGPVGRFADGGSASGGGASGGDPGGAIQLVAQGASTLADVYRETAAGVGEATDALRGVVPRMWDADRFAGYLTESTTAADTATARWRESLVGATYDLGLSTLATQAQTLTQDANTVANTENLAGLTLLGAEADLNNVERYPLTLLNTQTQTLAQQEGTLADTEHLLGMQLIGVETDLNVAERYPAVLLGTQTQTLATQEQTLADTENYTGLVLLGTQWDLASGTQLPTLTLATDTQTVATDLHTVATDLQTTALIATTDASTQTTAALGTQTTASTTASAATTALSGTLTTVTGTLNAAAAAASAYAAALNSIPTSVTTTVTTNFVTTGTPTAAAPAGFARGGMVDGPGTGTSDSILAALSAGEWVIRAAAAARQGPYRMGLLNAGRADIVPRFATGGRVGGYASGGMVRPQVSQPLAAGAVVVNNLSFETSVVVNGGTDAAATARIVRGEVDAALSTVARRVRAGTGRR